MTEHRHAKVLRAIADGYYCVICGKYLEADEYGVIVHDAVLHPETMTFDEDERPQ